MSTLERLRAERDRLMSRREHSLRVLAAERQRLALCERELADASLAAAALRECARLTQQSAHAAVAGVASHCLKAVFGDGAYGLGIDFVQKRGQTEAVLSFRRGGREIPPTLAAGGGACDVAALALRVAALALSKPKLRKLLVLDEPLRFVSAEYRGAAAVLLRTLAEQTGVQVLLVTHQSEFQVGTVLRLGERHKAETGRDGA